MWAVIHPHPGTLSRVRAAVEGCSLFPAAGRDVEGTQGCGSEYYVCEDEIITASTNGEREGKISQLLFAMQYLELAYYIKLSPASRGQACALRYELVRQTINPSVIPTLMNQQHHEMDMSRWCSAIHTR